MKHIILLVTMYPYVPSVNPVDATEHIVGLCEQGLQICSRESSPQLWAHLMSHLGDAYSNRLWVKVSEREANLAIALPCFQEALQILTRENAPQLWASTQIRLASAYRDESSGAFELAIECYKRALEVYNRENFPEQWARIQNEMLATSWLSSIFSADKQERIRNFTFGVACGERALEVLTQEKFPHDWAMVNSNLVGIYAEPITDGQIHYLQAAITAAENTLQIYPRHIAALQYLGVAYQAAGQLHHAYEKFEAAIEILELSKHEINSGVQAQQIWLGQWRDIYRKMVDVCLDLASDNQRYSAKAVEYVERYKACTLVQALSSREITIPSIVEEVNQELHHLKQELFSEQHRLAIIEKNMTSGGIFLGDNSTYPSQVPSSAIDRSRLIQLQEQLNDLIRQRIQPIKPDFALTQQVEPISFKEIQSLVNENTAIVEWYTTAEKLRTFVVIHGVEYPFVYESLENWHAFPFEEVEKVLPSSILQYFSYLKQRCQANLGDDYLSLMGEYLLYVRNYLENREQWRELLPDYLRHFAQILNLDQVVKSLPKTCNQLILIPHFMLHFLPIHALPLQDGTCLLDHCPGEIRYAPSCQVLQLIQSYNRSGFGRLLGVQNPTRDLDFSDIEVAAIRRMFSPYDDILIQESADKTAFYTQQLQDTHCLHFSCHGYFNFQNPILSALLSSRAKINSVVQRTIKMSLYNSL